MNLRTYHAPSIAEALGQIKRDLGPDAVILHTRTYRRGAIFGFGGRPAVEITASASVNVLPARPRRAVELPEPIRPVNADASRAASAYRAAASMPVSASVRDDRAIAGDTRADSVVMRVAGSPDEAETRSAAREVADAVVAAATRESPAPDALSLELASIKRLVGQVLRSTRAGSGPTMPDALTVMYLRLIESEVASEIAEDVISGVRDELSPAEHADADAVREAVLRRLERFIPVADDAEHVGAGADGRPRTIALVGPTGVGKTTTIAKLAATYKLRRGLRVGLVTCDTYRIAAVEQLRTYANIIGLPLNVALTPKEMASACAGLSDCDVVLVDTAGRSPHDGGRIDELGALLAAANPHETHLVLSGASSEAVLMRAVERFGVARPNRVILTKLDEAVSFGLVVNVAHRVGAALSYVTTGQEVPDHIEPGRSDRIARLVLTGGAVR